ncbi:MAG: DNA translocase FtsK [Dehalococcoidia bacterium]|nr:MAG: DNA translocase FtsK [Dehalococcoidia bacterium]
MVKKKDNKKNRTKMNNGKMPGRRGNGLNLGSLVRFLTSKWLRRFLLITIILVLFFWQWETVSSWVNDVAEGTIGLLGWGLVLIALAVTIVFGIIFRRRLTAFITRWKLYQWNKWLGATALLLAIWGILALYEKGGSFGEVLIGSSIPIGILRVLGLLLVGIVLIIPRRCWKALVIFFAWLVKLFRMPSLPIAKNEEKIPVVKPQFAEKVTEEEAQFKKMVPPPVLIPPEVSLKDSVSKDTKPAVIQPQPDLKQVAQEVWRKYGESPTLVSIDGWKLPPIDILDKTTEIEFGQADNVQRAKVIEDALASYGVNAKVVQINVGPTVTQFGVEPGWDVRTKKVKQKDENGILSDREEEVSRTRVKVDKITSLANDLALALSAPTIRIEAPVPGKPIVGIEVPNTSFSIVSLRGVIESNSFQKILARSSLALALGQGAGGESISGDLAKMPHLLIAGATGSGKTVCLNAVICCLLMYNTPFDTKLIMIDPKRVELAQFNALPHLATPVIVDTQKALNTMRWLNQEMDKRYQKLADAGARNIDGYNKTRQSGEKLPNLILIIDELADLMMAGFDEVEHILCRLAQLARAVGIHLVVATQRPSVDVVTGLIKANFPTRISFAVTSQVDSRTILDFGGAEKLLGRGDMLYMPTEASKPKRLQGCFVSDPEVERLVYFWSNQKPEEAAQQLKIEEIVPPVITTSRGGSYPKDPLLESAKQLADEHKNISTSFLQRKLHIGYPRAARLMEQLEEEMGKAIENGGAEV